MRSRRHVTIDAGDDGGDDTVDDRDDGRYHVDGDDDDDDNNDGWAFFVFRSLIFRFAFI